MKMCTVEDCDRAAIARNFCSRHYQRFRLQGVLDELAPDQERPCAHCGETIQPGARRWSSLYCSGKCKQAAADARRVETLNRRRETCEQCGDPLAARRRDARFCSTKCGQTWRNRQIAERLRAKKQSQARRCYGCGGDIPVERNTNAIYCSDECKSRSRRHESYGLTKPDLELLLAQHEQCAICHTEDWGGKGPQVDHCHATGKVRGILCINCNNGLGRFDDDPARLRAAAAYLEAHR